MSHSIIDNAIIYNAIFLRDQVLKTWSPPLKSGNETKAQIAQTAVMQTMAFIFGKDFFEHLTDNQEKAIDEGLLVMNEVLKSSN